MDFGYELEERDKRLSLRFKKKAIAWERPTSKLMEDRVILDFENAKELLDEKGDLIVYKVFKLGEFVDGVKEISDKFGISCDLTLLRHGIFSPFERGELFSTYGHIHEKKYGEAYSILKNECYILLSDVERDETFLVYLPEGNSIFIHPRFLHRLVSHRRDCLVVGLVPESAGHDYSAVKNKGFPFHIFFDKKREKIEVVKNKRYKLENFDIVKGIKTEINPVKIFEKRPARLKDILESPEKHRKVYFSGK